MNVEPVGLPVPLKAWRQREPEPLLRIVCGADPGCGTEVGTVYRTPQGEVVESRLEAPREQPRAAPPPLDLAAFANELGLTGMLADVEVQEGAAEEAVRAQVDLLHSGLYWHDPVPVCPSHGPLRIDRAVLAQAVRDGDDPYEATPQG